MAWTARRQKAQKASSLPTIILQQDRNGPIFTTTRDARISKERRYASNRTRRTRFEDDEDDEDDNEYIDSQPTRLKYKYDKSQRVIPVRNRPATQTQLGDAISTLRASLKSIVGSDVYQDIKGIGHRSGVRWSVVKKDAVYASLISVLRLLHVSVSMWTSFNTYHCFEHSSLECMRHEVDSLEFYDFPEIEKNSNSDRLLERHYKVIEKHLNLLVTIEEGSFHSRTFSKTLLRREEAWLKSNPQRLYELVKEFWDDIERRRIQDYKVIGQLRSSVRAQKFVTRRSSTSRNEEQVLEDILKERELPQRARDFLYDMAFFSNECIAWWTDLQHSPVAQSQRQRTRNVRNRSDYARTFESSGDGNSIETIVESFHQRATDLDQHEEHSKRTW